MLPSTYLLWVLLTILHIFPTIFYITSYTPCTFFNFMMVPIWVWKRSHAMPPPSSTIEELNLLRYNFMGLYVIFPAIRSDNFIALMLWILCLKSKNSLYANQRWGVMHQTLPIRVVKTGDLGPARPSTWAWDGLEPLPGPS